MLPRVFAAVTRRVHGVAPLLALLLSLPLSASASDPEWDAWEKALTEEAKATEFDDAPLEEAVVHPSWFRLSFLHLGEDLRDAVRFGKVGLVVYFGQKYCPYCQALMERNFGQRDIATYTRRHFDVVAIDVHGDRTVTDLQGRELGEKAFAEREKANLTPTLLFYDKTGQPALKLTGYYPPYKFRAALEYVADGHYRNETFRDYLLRADPELAARDGELNPAPFFAAPPHNLDRSRLPGQRPLVVFFEQGDCHACDVLHSGPLTRDRIRERLAGFDSVQLDIWADTPVVTPAGERTTARAWAEALGLFYTPTLVFFDERGTEVVRLDSVAHFNRIRRTLDYVRSGAHRQGIGLQQWQREGM